MPDLRARDYSLAFTLAAKDLSKQHPQEIARRSGAFVEEKKGQIFIDVEVLARRHIITYPQMEITLEDPQEQVPLWKKVLILHYLQKASGVPLQGRLVTFQEIESGPFYMPIFRQRVLNPLVASFGEHPEALVETAVSHFNGEPRGHGDASVTVFALPYVPITLVIWKGDEEFPPQGNLLFDSTVSLYLDIEDLTAVAQVLVEGLISVSRERGAIP
jgi:hypothetical protein